jgi:23S rRNA (adenine2503-C2)-methyltransferase
MLRGLTCKINLILYNPGTAAPLAPTSESAAEAFREFLTKAHFTASLRRSKGRGLLAACGQLAAHVRGLEQDEAGPSQISADQEEKQP